MANASGASSYAEPTKSFSGLLRDTFAHKLADGRSDVAVIQSMLEMNEVADAPGNQIRMPVIMGFQGGTVGWLFGQVGSSATAKPALIDYAYVTAGSLVTPVNVPFDLATALNGEAYETEAGLLAVAGKSSHEREVEISILLGGEGVGAVSSVGSVTQVGSSSTYQVTVTLTAQSWADGIWAASDNLDFDAYDVTGVTQRNTNLAITVHFVDFNNKQITFYGNQTDLGNIAPTDIIWRRGLKGAESIGMKNVLRQGSGGSAFGLDTTNSGFRALGYDNGALPLSYRSLSKAVSQAIARGLGGDQTVFTSTASYADLEGDFADLRRLDGSYSAGTLANGASKIEYKSRIGKLSIIAHPVVQYGETYVGPKSAMFLVGTQKPTMEINGKQLAQMASTQAFDERIFSNVAWTTNQLSRFIRISNITPAA